MRSLKKWNNVILKVEKPANNVGRGNCSKTQMGESVRP